MKIMGAALAAALTFGTASASAADLTEQDRTDLRQRAQELQNQRSRDPDFQPGQGRLNAQPEATATTRVAQKTKPQKADGAKKETRRERVAKKARSLKKIPGAFLRNR